MQINYIQDIMPTKWLINKDNFFYEEWAFLNNTQLRHVIQNLKIKSITAIQSGGEKNFNASYILDSDGKLSEFYFSYEFNGTSTSTSSMFKYNENGFIEEIRRTATDQIMNINSQSAYFEYAGGLVSKKYEKTYCHRMFEYNYNNFNMPVSITKNKFMPPYPETIDIKRLNYSKYGTLTYEYDNSGNLICEMEFDSAGNCAHKKNYIYGLNGNLKELSEHDSSAMLMKKNYHYDAGGSLTAETTEYAGGSHLIMKYNYDANGLLSEASMSDSEVTVKKTIFSYDDKGLVTRKSDSDTRVGNNCITTYNYVYFQ